MKIKKYTALSMQDGLSRIRREMGPDAVIIESRKRRHKGFQGYFLPKMLEITAAVDSSEEKKKDKYHSALSDGPNVGEEFVQLKNMMQKILSQQEINATEGDKTLAYWQKRLIGNDVESEYATDLLSGIAPLSDSKNLSSEIMETLVLSKLSKSILTAELPKKIKYISFVGPTGVGKTTTLAKLAADFTYRQNKKTAIITVDTYRIGALEQLKAYSEITGIPLCVVYSVEEMKAAVEKFKDSDVVLIDTAGRSAQNPLQIAETAQYLNCIATGAVFLVISATTKVRDLRKIAQAFSKTGYNGLILTKIDETDTFGNFLNVCRITSLPIYYITTGQNVPDDIEPAAGERMADMVLGEDSDG
ncbi:MAG: flagellar biosynthesis protein FlhF [Dethiobacter sp.]|jgi:flagellar biosynthesis protein FlhF|nr:flagellar biosynthesis protein FlhF [Dethiobacter sp.]